MNTKEIAEILISEIRKDADDWEFTVMTMYYHLLDVQKMGALKGLIFDYNDVAFAINELYAHKKELTIVPSDTVYKFID